MKPIETAFTRQLGLSCPVVVAPMFLVSNEDMVVEGSEAGALGSFPALNYRPIEKYREALKEIRRRTQKPIGVNIIVNKSNARQGDDLKIALEQGVNLFITSLGNPKEVIREAHRQGAKVYCDVTNLEHALKVEDLGADGVIAVSSGAGGHAGPLSPLVLIPWLKTRLKVPILLAGGVAQGSQLTAALALGAAGVSVGTRFIASTEAQVSAGYKEAILKSTPEDVVLTTRVSGTPASVINTEYIKKTGTDLPWILKVLKSNPRTKNLATLLVHAMGMKSLEKAAQGTSWKEVWSAGQSVGLIEEVKPVRRILEQMVEEHWATVKSLA